ncbi:hypothetical protein BpHYR1_010544 [Brachionus plicatilis]|uniref:Uncharacterized protein n=1 Tax=Brachionus plicatilis TaxID=10195 RepID=A0A3M7T8Q6_BRAPC|nr:hypothetical protein BpHYR1_010544 [Brachionus plicatilis]
MNSSHYLRLRMIIDVRLKEFNKNWDTELKKYLKNRTFSIRASEGKNRVKNKLATQLVNMHTANAAPLASCLKHSVTYTKEKLPETLKMW